MKEYQRLSHGFDPVYDSNSRVLILGSFPSVKSREIEFYYGHPQNRFWRILSQVLNSKVPETTNEKKELLLSHGIALWDVIDSCEIIGSSDATIRNVIPARLSEIFDVSDIQAVFVNGKTAERLYHKYSEKVTGMKAVGLPSTSPANASFSMERLFEQWKVIQKYMKL